MAANPSVPRAAWLAALAVLIATLSFGTPASAAPAAAPTADPPRPEAPHRLVWRYPRFRWWEYVAAGSVSVGNISMEVLYQGEPRDRFTDPVLSDAVFRSWLRADTAEGRLRADDISDYMWHGSTYYVLLDGILTPLVSDRFNTDVAFQLTLLNWQAIGLTGLLARLAHVSVGRTRPSLQGCTDDPESENPCGFRGASFVAGHAMMTSANAGLACANHLALPLYGGGVADAAVCPVMITTALSVGLLRLVADKHWLSDTLPGWVVGGGIGFGLPWLLHYRAVRTVASPLPGTALLPWADSSSVGLNFAGQL